MQKRLKKIIWLFVLLISGCHIPADLPMDGGGGRNAYNMAIQVSTNEQMLLNLVRLRYFEHPCFMDVNNVTTQFTYSSGISASVPIPGFNKDNPFVLGGNVSWANQPTLQFTPLDGAEFSQQLLNPINLQMIQQLIYSGWDVDRVFRLTIQSFASLKNAPQASGPIIDEIPEYDAFFEATKLLRHFQILGQLQVGVHTRQSKKGEVQNLQIAFPYEGEEAKKLASLLPGVYSSNGNYVLSMELGFNVKGELGIYPRSILSCLYYLSRSVFVPQRDMDSGKVGITLDEQGTLFRWKDIIGRLLEIQNSDKRPKNAYISVKYRDTWFYIEDSDIQSKQTFLLLLQLYVLQATPSKQPPPILTLPLGGA